MPDHACPRCGQPAPEDDILCLPCIRQVLDGWVPDATDLTSNADIKPGGPITPATQWDNAT